MEGRPVDTAVVALQHILDHSITTTEQVVVHLQAGQKAAVRVRLQRIQTSNITGICITIICRKCSVWLLLLQT